MYPVIELSGPDRVGKTTLREAITRQYEKHGLDNLAYAKVLDRGVYDCMALDFYFDRSVPEVIAKRYSFLTSAKGYYVVVELTASKELLEYRQKQQIDAGELDGASWNQQVIDYDRMLKAYAKCDEWVNSHCMLDGLSYSHILLDMTSMSADAAAKRLADLGYLW